MRVGRVSARNKMGIRKVTAILKCGGRAIIPKVEAMAEETADTTAFQTTSAASAPQPDTLVN